MESLFKVIIKNSLISAFGAHVAKTVIDHTGSLRGRIYSFIGNTTSAILPQRVQNLVSTLVITMLSKLDYLAGRLQEPMNRIQEKQNQIAVRLEDIERQQRYGAIFNLINRTLIAPFIEESLYRGSQIAGSIFLKQITGLDILSSQAIIGTITNTMFGLAHTNGRTVVNRVTSEEFIHSFSKGFILATSAALILQGNAEESELAKAAASLAAAIVGHSLSNFLDAIKNFHREWNE